MSVNHVLTAFMAVEACQISVFSGGSGYVDCPCFLRYESPAVRRLDHGRVYPACGFMGFYLGCA
jgi:hypothetical protein